LLSQQLARVAIRDFLGKVFYIERQIEAQREARERSGRTWDLSETQQIRQTRSAPIMAAFKAWVDELLPGVPPKMSECSHVPIVIETSASPHRAFSTTI